ncbi:MAG TPA: N-acetyl-gamma-glutamyl-phosphate reductase, partial [Bacillota bacterium]
MSRTLLRAAIWGVTGYAGRELARLLLAHPGVEVAAAISREPASSHLAGIHPSFAALPGAAEVTMLPSEPAPDLAGIDVVFFALPHGASAEPAAAALAAGCRVVDLGADFRLRDAQAYEQWYGRRHPVPELLSEAVYGLPEWTARLHDGRDPLPGARLVAVPGCYPTGALLALLPLAAAGLLDPDSIVIDSKSGASGAGRSPGDHFTFSEVHGNVRAYGVARHRHTPEIEQARALTGSDRPVSFTPHLIPASRGILTTVYARLAGDLPVEAAAEAAADA